MMYVSRHNAIDDLKADISLRLRPVCSHFPEAEFDALVDRIAGIEYKYAQKAARIVPTSFFTERVEEKPEERGEGTSEISP
jgi:hypothetical protein